LWRRLAGVSQYRVARFTVYCLRVKVLDFIVILREIGEFATFTLKRKANFASGK